MVMFIDDVFNKLYVPMKFKTFNDVINERKDKGDALKVYVRMFQRPFFYLQTI